LFFVAAKSGKMLNDMQGNVPVQEQTQTGTTDFKTNDFFDILREIFDIGGK
jgi:hypothetical protein